MTYEQSQTKCRWLLVCLAAAGLGLTGADWRGVPDDRDEKNKLRKARDKKEPDRCRLESKWRETWKEKRSGGGGGGGVVGGTGGEAEKIHPLYGWEYKYFCGEEVRGLHGSFYENDRFSGYLSKNDPRVIMGKGIYNEDGSKRARELVSVVLRHQCFTRTNWSNAAEQYPAYYWCKRRTQPEDMPSRSRVKKLVEELLPGMNFEQKNMLWLFDNGKKMRKKVVKGFEKFEKNFPIVEKIYDDGTKKGIQRYEGLRETYPDVYSYLDPITEKLEKGEKPPADCGPKLNKMQDKVAAKEGVEGTVQAVHDFRAAHPAGRQFTEALAYCYSYDDNGKAEYSLARELLTKSKSFQRIGYTTLQSQYPEPVRKWEKKQGNLLPTDRVYHNVPPARITKSQHIVHARQDAWELQRAKLNLAGKAEDKIPAFLSGETNVPDPLRSYVVQERPIPREDIEYQAKGEWNKYFPVGSKYGNDTFADRKMPAPVIESIAEIPPGFQLEFPSNSYTTTEVTCDNWKETDKVKAYEWEGDRRKVIYEKKCLSESKKTFETTKQLDPLILSEYEGERLEEGVRIYARTDRTAPKDSMLVDAWWSDKELPDAAIQLRGVRVNWDP